MSNKGQVGIIGYGRFGRLAARIIQSHFPDVRILVYARKRERLGKSGGVEFAILDDVCKSDVVLPCVPISAFEEVIKTISGKLKQGALVMDVCSVKVHPVEIMIKCLPANVEMLATHPNFGPDSTRRGLHGLKIILYKVRIGEDRYQHIKQNCKDLGLEVLEMSPEEHDRLMAYSMAFTHLIGRLGERMGLKNTPIDTQGFAQLMKVQDYVVNDTFTLFQDMQRYNPYAKEMRRRLRQALGEIESGLGD